MLHPVQGVLVVEGVQTGDGRIITEGAVTWVNPPLPLAWIVEGDQHVDLVEVAPQIGTINTILRSGNEIVWAGAIDDAIPDGAEMVRRMQNGSAPLGSRWGISIDPDDYEVELVDTTGEMEPMMASGNGPFPTFGRRLTADAGEGDPADGVVVLTDSADALIARFTRLRIRGATACAVAAFDGAYMELSVQPVTAAGESCSCGGSCTSCATAPLIAAAAFTPAADLASPPLEWFEDPRFTDDDIRLVRQPDGQLLCPLTVTAEGRVFGHFAGWSTCHTGYESVCVPPPHSQTGYAAFMLRPLETAEGEIITVGHIPMGCGHIPDNGQVPLDVVRAFYDGGPGAVQMARVRVGEDAYGGWFAGALAEGVTDDQVRRFSTLSVSGHWREVWRGKGLDLIACVAGVTVPGFPVSAMAAAGFVPTPLEPGFELPAPHVHFSEGRPIVLVAAGVAKRPAPWERMIAALSGEVAQLRRRLDAAERVIEPLQSTSLERIDAVLAALMADGTTGIVSHVA